MGETEQAAAVSEEDAGTAISFDELPLESAKISIIGAGSMGGALVRGFCGSAVVKPENITVCDNDARRLAEFQDAGVRITEELRDTTEKADFIILAVKPQFVSSVVRALPELRKGFPSPLLISVAAGISLENLRNYVGGPARIARVMPNLACEIRQGMVAVYAADEEERREALRLFEPLGRAVLLQEERELDFATALAGSGPAFTAVFAEALAEGALMMGLSREHASLFAAQTLLGTAQLLLETGAHPTELKEKVSSPGGTTVAGLYALERGAMRGTIMTAVEAAAKRARELAE